MLRFIPILRRPAFEAERNSGAARNRTPFFFRRTAAQEARMSRRNGRHRCPRTPSGRESSPASSENLFGTDAGVGSRIFIGDPRNVRSDEVVPDAAFADARAGYFLGRRTCTLDREAIAVRDGIDLSRSSGHALISSRRARGSQVGSLHRSGSRFVGGLAGLRRQALTRGNHGENLSRLAGARRADRS